VRGDFGALLAITDGGTSVIDEIEPPEQETNEYREASRRALAFF
jgi:hypothetical protein